MHRALRSPLINSKNELDIPTALIALSNLSPPFILCLFPGEEFFDQQTTRKQFPPFTPSLVKSSYQEK